MGQRFELLGISGQPYKPRLIFAKGTKVARFDNGKEVLLHGGVQHHRKHQIAEQQVSFARLGTGEELMDDRSQRNGRALEREQVFDRASSHFQSLQ